MKHLKLFQTEAEYTAFKGSEDFVTPNVSYAIDNTKVYYELGDTSSESEPLPDLPINLYADNYYPEVASYLIQEYQNLRNEFDLTATSFIINRDGYLSTDKNGSPMEINISHKAIFKYLSSLNIDDEKAFNYLEFNSSRPKFYDWQVVMDLNDDGYLYYNVDD